MERVRHSRKTAFLGVMLAAVLVGLVAPPATAGHVACGVSDQTPEPGQTITVRGSGFAPGTIVRIWYDDPNQRTLIGRDRVNQNQRFREQVTIPANAEPGTAAIIIKGRDPHSGNRVTCKVIIQVQP